VIIYLTLNHFLVIPALYTARFEYIGWYLECVNDYPVCRSPQLGYGVQDILQ
jgi:hypothetical protein